MWTVLAALLFSTTSSYILVMDFKTWENAEKHCQTKFNSSLASFEDSTGDSGLLSVAQKAKLLDPWIDWSGDRNYYIGCPTDDCGRPYDPVIEPYPYPTGHPRCPVVRRSATFSPWIDLVKCTDPSRRPFICNNPDNVLVSCERAGILYPGLPHACECNNSCKEENIYCNTYEFVFGKVGGLSPDEIMCPQSKVCCCSCQNCPGYISTQAT
eukprot:517315_1